MSLTRVPHMYTHVFHMHGYIHTSHVHTHPTHVHAHPHTHYMHTPYIRTRAHPPTHTPTFHTHVCTAQTHMHTHKSQTHPTFNPLLAGVALFLHKLFLLTSFLATSRRTFGRGTVLLYMLEQGEPCVWMLICPGELLSSSGMPVPPGS